MNIIHHTTEQDVAEISQYTEIRYAIVNVKPDGIHQFTPIMKCRDFLNEFLYLNMSPQAAIDKVDNTTKWGYSCKVYPEFDVDQTAVFFSKENTYSTSGNLLEKVEEVDTCYSPTDTWQEEFFGEAILQLNKGVVVKPPRWAYVNAAAFLSWVGCVRLALYTNSSTEAEMTSKITDNLDQYYDVKAYSKLKKQLGMNSMLEFFGLPCWENIPFVLSQNSSDMSQLHDNSGIHTILGYISKIQEDGCNPNSVLQYRAGDVAVAIINNLNQLKKAS